MSSSMSPQVFSILSALVEERLGLHYGFDDLEIFGEKVTARARVAGFESALDYYYYLRYDAGGVTELDLLADALVVGETYFFRELEPLRAAITQVVVPAVRARGTARIWSAACATGEEALSVAMLLEEAGVDAQCRILATDLSARALARARDGIYGGRSMRSLPPHPPPAGMTPALAAVAERSLVHEAAQRVRAARTLTERIELQQLNLLDASAIAALGRFDLVLCRNVLIYFADATITRVLDALAGALETDGRLLVGASESLLRFGTVLSCEERGGAFLYRRQAS